MSRGHLTFCRMVENAERILSLITKEFSAMLREGQKDRSGHRSHEQQDDEQTAQEGTLAQSGDAVTHGLFITPSVRMTTAYLKTAPLSTNLRRNLRNRGLRGRFSFNYRQKCMNRMTS